MISGFLNILLLRLVQMLPASLSGTLVDTATAQTITARKTFTATPIFSNMMRVGTSEVFFQDATPATRNDGTALVADDLWYETDTNIWWFWNGTYWLSCNLFFNPMIQAQNLSAQTDYLGMWQISGANDIFVVDLIGSALVSTTNTGDHYWIATLYRRDSFTSLGTFNTSANGADAFKEYAAAINTHLDVSVLTDKAFDLRMALNGTPGNIYGQFGFTFRLAHV